MKKENLSDVELHSAGATVRNQSIFEDLKSYVNEVDITQEFRKEWVIPFYMKLGNQSAEWVQKMIQLKPQITKDVILQNLGDFNWRTRSTGSYFACIKQFTHLEDIIGTHLLKSEVCYAGARYAYTLATFNTKKSVDYLSRYLDFYLERPDLYFDQEIVIIALKYLDEVNSTSYIDKHLGSWEDFQRLRNEQAIDNLKRLKQTIPERTEDFETQIQELKPRETSINTDRFKGSLKTLNKIING